MYHIGCDLHCYDNDAESTKATRKVTLVFHREQLIYDIKNCAYIEGHVWGEDNQHGQHTLVEIGEEGNIDRVNRILSQVHADAVEMLYPYTKHAPEDNEVFCDKMVEPSEYIIEMMVPPSMSKTTLRLLNELIHEFMVARAIYDWLCITHREAAEHWLVKAKSAANRIKNIKHSRGSVLKRPSYPF